jgi:peroxiredoxin
MPEHDPAPGRDDTAAVPAGRWWRDSLAGHVAVVAVATVLVLAGLWVAGGSRGEADEPVPGATGDRGTSPVELTAAAAGDPPEVGRPAPDFTTFAVDGTDVVLSDLRGQPVWLLFGATWCSSCRAESPDVQAVQEAYGDRARIVAIHVGESISTVGDFADRLGLTYTHVADSYTDLGSAYRVMGLPTHVFVDADGVVGAIEVGTITEQAASARLDALLRD